MVSDSLPQFTHHYAFYSCKLAYGAFGIGCIMFAPSNCGVSSESFVVEQLLKGRRASLQWLIGCPLLFSVARSKLNQFSRECACGVCLYVSGVALFFNEITCRSLMLFEKKNAPPGLWARHTCPQGCWPFCQKKLDCLRSLYTKFRPNHILFVGLINHRHGS